MSVKPRLRRSTTTGPASKSTGRMSAVQLRDFKGRLKISYRGIRTFIKVHRPQLNRAFAL
jgi:hypothetical protein